MCLFCKQGLLDGHHSDNIWFLCFHILQKQRFVVEISWRFRALSCVYMLPKLNSHTGCFQMRNVASLQQTDRSQRYYMSISAVSTANRWRFGGLAESVDTLHLKQIDGVIAGCSAGGGSRFTSLCENTTSNIFQGCTDSASTFWIWTRLWLWKW